MASSNRHWPSMFKSKPCNTHHHQWQHDINPSSLMSSTCQRSSFNSSGGGGGGGGGVSGEERSPEPKPRWNPKPEQIRILEAIFNSGMVNPPRDEIRKIRAQLQEYGQVGDANVFYWFQNRKSRSKHKQKHHHHHLQSQHKTQLLSSSSLVSITNTASTVAPTLLAPLHQTSSSSSSSSSESKTSPKGTTHDHHENKNITSSSTSESLLGSLMSSMSSSGNSLFNVSHDVSNSPLHQTSSSHHAGFLSSSSSSTSHLHEQFFFPTSTTTSTSGVQNNFAVFPHHGLGFSAPTDPSSLDVLHHDHQVISSGPSHGLLLSEFLMMNHQNGSKRILDRQDHDHQLLMMNYSSIDANTCTTTTTNGHNASMLSPTPTTATATTTHARFDVNPIQGVTLMGAPADAPRLTVFINDVVFEVSVGPFNVREAFGDDALLIHSSGQPVLTNDWGVTLQSLQPGASYYLVI